MRERKRWVTVVLYAMAMAWVEAAVAFYLRTMMDQMDPHHPYPVHLAKGIGHAELVREAATMVMLLTVPSTSTKRRSRKRIPRSESRSSARSMVTEVVRPAAASVFAVGGLRGHGPPRAIVLAPGGAGTRVVTRSPGLLFLRRLVHDVAPLLMVEKGGCQGE